MPDIPFARGLLDIFLNQAPDFVGVYEARTGRFTRVNAAGVQLLGYVSEEALLAGPGRALRTPAFSDADWTQLCEHAQAEGRQEVETEVTRADGTAFPARMELNAFEVAGMPYFLVRLGKPSRLWQVERELADSHRRYEAVVTSATIGIIVCNRAGGIVSANQMAHQQFGFPPGELRATNIDRLVPRLPGTSHEKLRESYNTNPQVRPMAVHRGELFGLRRDGTVFPAEVSLSYFYLDEELHVVSYVIDISEKKTAQQALVAERQRVERLNADLEQKVADRTHALLNTLEQLEQRKEELAQALAAEQELGELKSRFVSMASHEFRTPLTAVLTSASLIEQYPASEQQDKRVRHLDRIKQSVIHLNDILEEFLSVGRIEEGRVQARPAQVDLATLLDETVMDVQGLLKSGQTIRQDVSCPAPLWLDASLLRKILVNLLSNGLKYSDDHAVVTVRAACAAGQLVLSVEDKGVGISREDQEHLFERFFRARNVTNVPGTGLGLYIVARYLDLMRGTITLQSELAVGTTVTITLPYENHSAD